MREGEIGRKPKEKNTIVIFSPILICLLTFYIHFSYNNTNRKSRESKSERVTQIAVKQDIPKL